MVLQSGLAVAFPIGTWKSSVIDVSWLVLCTAAGLTAINIVALVLAQLEGEVWPGGAHLEELRLINGRRTVVGLGCVHTYWVESGGVWYS